MTKEEFWQEAALRMLGVNPNWYDNEIIDRAKDFADAFFKEAGQQEQEEQASASSDDYLSRSIQEVIDEVDRLDLKASRKRGADILGRFSKAGYAKKINSFCDMISATTVGDLIKYGKNNAMESYRIGIGSIHIVDTALKNLYGIEEW